MSTDTVCRVCLVNNLNMYGVRNELQNAYERITREKFNKVGYPTSMCYICLSVLRKCNRFMKTARDSNRLLEQWHYQQTQMRVAKPLATYSISKVQFVSLETEDISSEIDIKIENVELAEQSVVDIQTEYAECKTDVHIEKKDTDEQTDNTTDTTYNDTTPVTDDKQTDPLFDNMDKKWSTLDMISQHNNDDSQISQDIEIAEVKTEIETNDEIQLSSSSGIEIPKDLNTEIKKQDPHESDTDNIVADDVCHTENISKDTKSGILSRKFPRNEKILHTCDICNKSYTSASSLRRHFETHSTKKINNAKNKLKQKIITYSCTKCTYEFKGKNLLRKHLKTHRSDKPFSCDKCSHKFAYKSHLLRHVKTHTGKKPFSCDICSYRSTEKSHLTPHMRIHSGEKPFVCDTCTYECIKKSDLRKHIRIHTGEKPFACDLCSYKFFKRADLTRHIRTHTGEKPFGCNICGYKCAQSSGLTRHMRTHTGEKPFSCDICSFKCIQKSNLVTHMMAHGGEKPFSCDICSYKCVLKSHLRRHMTNHSRPIFVDINVTENHC